MAVSYLIYPQLANDNIVNNSLDFPPCVVIATLGELKMSDAHGLHLKVFSCIKTNVTINPCSQVYFSPLNLLLMVNSCQHFQPAFPWQCWATIGG